MAGQTVEIKLVSSGEVWTEPKWFACLTIVTFFSSLIIKRFYSAPWFKSYTYRLVPLGISALYNQKFDQAETKGKSQWMTAWIVEQK